MILQETAIVIEDLTVLRKTGATSLRQLPSELKCRDVNFTIF